MDASADAEDLKQSEAAECRERGAAEALAQAEGRESALRTELAEVATLRALLEVAALRALVFPCISSCGSADVTMWRYSHRNMAFCLLACTLWSGSTLLACSTKTRRTHAKHQRTLHGQWS